MHVYPHTKTHPRLHLDYVSKHTAHITVDVSTRFATLPVLKQDIPVL